jgi:hypothetical protein
MTEGRIDSHTSQITFLLTERTRVRAESTQCDML